MSEYQKTNNYYGQVAKPQTIEQLKTEIYAKQHSLDSLVRVVGQKDSTIARLEKQNVDASRFETGMLFTFGACAIAYLVINLRAK